MSLVLATSAVVLATGVGVRRGTPGGYLGGRLDDLVMRLADVQLSFPVIMLAIAIVAVVGTSPVRPGRRPRPVRVGPPRADRARERAHDPPPRVRGRRPGARLRASAASCSATCCPNTLAPILVIVSSQFATMVLLESGLSFLGMGVQPPQPSWGGMLAEGRDYLSNAWWLATVPGIAISLVVLGANLLGDGLRDLLDPHLHV